MAAVITQLRKRQLHRVVYVDVMVGVWTAGPGLVFVVYPAAIARMPGSPVWAALFFVFLFTVGVDSQVRCCRRHRDTLHCTTLLTGTVKHSRCYCLL